MNDLPPTDSSRAPLSFGDYTRLVLAVLLPIAVLVTAILLTVDIEMIIGCFPVCCVLGVLLTFAVTTLRSWLVFLWAVSAPLAVAGCSLAIGLSEWDPREAQYPICATWWCYTMLLLPIVPPALRTIWRWRAAENPSSRLQWRFQIKFLLVLMAALSVFLTFVRVVSGKRIEHLLFAGGAAGLLLVLGIAFSLFWARLSPVDESDSMGY